MTLFYSIVLLLVFMTLINIVNEVRKAINGVKSRSSGRDEEVEIPDDLLADENLIPDEMRHLAAQRKAEALEKGSTIQKLATGVTVLVGVPMLVGFGIVIFMISIMSG